jgi:hypothetical protein
VLETDEKGRIKLSHEGAAGPPEGMPKKSAASAATVATARRVVIARTARAVAIAAIVTSVRVARHPCVTWRAAPEAAPACAAQRHRAQAARVKRGMSRPGAGSHAMRAIEITQPGGPEVLRRASGPTRCRQPGELLIARAGLGCQPAGRAAAQGPVPHAARRVRPAGAGECRHGGRWRAEDLAAAGWPSVTAVCALVAGGGYAELCVAPVASACRCRGA